MLHLEKTNHGGRAKEAPTSKGKEGPLSAKELELMNACWRACNFLSVGMIYPKKEEMKQAIIDNTNYAHENGADRPEISHWTWPY